MSLAKIAPPADRPQSVLTVVLWILLAFGMATSSDAAEPDQSQAEILTLNQAAGRLLVSRCLECHVGPEPAGGLDVSRRDKLLAGGESGPAVKLDKPAESLLWQRVRQGEMPPKKPILQPAERQLLQDWLAAGAHFAEEPLDLFRYTTAQRAGYDWWALRPLARPDIPEVADEGWARNGIDRFIAQGLDRAGLKPSPEADRRTLIRRLSFDLLGLPPAPEEVARFLADSQAGAYERVVDRLLASPHFGTRWARRWLDLARFGESQGFERDKLRDNAWPYRDWVVQAFNDDMAYDRFARLQIAGDVLFPEDPLAAIATGFLVAGPYDEVGQNQQSAAMKAVVRQDELEDIASVVGQTFLGLTVNCARCHDHKFDPIRQREYYQLTAALAGVRHGTRELISSADRRKAGQFDQRLAAITSAQSILLARAGRRLREEHPNDDSRSRVPRPLWCWAIDGSNAERTPGVKLHGAARVTEAGLLLDGSDAYLASAPLEADLRAKTLVAWVRLAKLDQQGGGAISVQTLNGSVFDAIVFGEREAAVG